MDRFERYAISLYFSAGIAALGYLSQGDDGVIFVCGLAACLIVAVLSEKLLIRLALGFLVGFFPLAVAITLIIMFEPEGRLSTQYHERGWFVPYREAFVWGSILGAIAAVTGLGVTRAKHRLLGGSQVSQKPSVVLLSLALALGWVTILLLHVLYYHFFARGTYVFTYVDTAVMAISAWTLFACLTWGRLDRMWKLGMRKAALISPILIFAFLGYWGFAWFCSDWNVSHAPIRTLRDIMYTIGEETFCILAIFGSLAFPLYTVLYLTVLRKKLLPTIPTESPLVGKESESTAEVSTPPSPSCEERRRCGPE